MVSKGQTDMGFGFLENKPRIKGVNGFFNWGFLEKRAGKKDSGENQICEIDGGHTSPWVNNKRHCCDSYINKIYTQTVLDLDPMVKEANAMVVELGLIMSTKPEVINSGDGEESARRAAASAASAAFRIERRETILKRLSEIKAESDMIDEALKHHLERAEEILHAHVSNYWRGVLSASSGGLGHYPIAIHEVTDGIEAYESNRKTLVEMIGKALKEGGFEYVEREEREVC